MGSKDDLQTALRSLRNVRRMARRLQRVPVDCLRVNSGDIADAEYVTEWLGIVLCRVCGQQDVSMPPFEAGAAPVAQFRWFIQKAARQAGAIRRAILLGRVFDTADGLYCGSINPLRTRQLMQEAAYGK